MDFIDDLFQLHVAAANGRIEDFIFFMSENPRDRVGLTPLHFAAVKGRDQMCKFILELPEVEDKNPTCLNYGSTPLHLAAIIGHIEVCKLILPYLIDKNPGDNRGSTPLHYAAGKGQLEVCKLFIENLNDINPGNSVGSTPSVYAIRQGHFIVAKLFPNQFVQVHMTIPGQLVHGNENPQPRYISVCVPSHELEQGPGGPRTWTVSPFLRHILAQAVPSVRGLPKDEAVEYLQLQISNAFN